MSSETALKDIITRARAFEKEADRMLSKEEAAPERVISIKETYKLLTGLSLKQDELIRQSLRCIENELFRAAHVLSWAALMDFIEARLSRNKFGRLNRIRPSWKVKSLDDLREVGSDYQIIEVLRDLKLCSKIEDKALKGLLNKRNECAHPTDYFPDLNQSLGYVSEVLQRLKTFQTRWKRV
ncbi:MAG: hypothetical protein HY247_05855 [archaeon]|nr:MAG: hypothetical protein HY247_05855 [archaeon]